jgi:hypothetical protein
MGGGLMQLVAYGAQDIYLTGNPQITFFKVVYRRHTNFAMECVEQTLSGTSTANNTGNDVNCTATVSRNGDLVGKMYVSSSTTGITDGAELAKQVDVEIGGQRIDRHYKEWMQVLTELSTPESKALGVKAMTGCVGSSGTTGVGMVQVPLQFWFCRNPGLALPLIALQYHEVKIKLTLGAASGAAAACKLWADYIYLDTDERRRFAQVSHEYLIEQIQKEESTNKKTHTLNFNHPVKELIWTSPADNAYANAKLQLNGHDRFSAQEEEYFQLRHPSDHHTAIPKQNLPAISQANSGAYLDVTTGKVGGAKTTFTADTFGATGDVATSRVEVGKGGTGISSTMAAATMAATTAEAVTATTMVFHFLKTDLVVLPEVGDLVEIDVSGTNSALGTLAECATNLAGLTIRAEVTATAEGALTGMAGTGNYHIQFSNTLLENTLDAAVTAASGLTIGGLRVKKMGQARTSQLTSKINCYSFALKPEEHQPSGTCNFSRIDNAKLVLNTAPGGSINIYAVNYNVLRVMSGMGGLAYSN